MAYKRYYTDEKILELCKKLNIDSDNIDSPAIEQKMLNYYESHKIGIKKQNINEIENKLLLNLQKKGINFLDGSGNKDISEKQSLITKK